MKNILSSIQKIPAGYKQTEIGVIPEEWDVKEMEDFTISVTSGKSNTTNELGDYPIYGSTGIIGYRKQPDYSGDKVLIARVGANAGTVNEVSGKYCVSDNTLMVTYQSGIDINFSYYQLINFKLNKLIFGSGQPLVTGSQIKKIAFALPKNKTEQIAITTVLSDTDALIECLEKLIAKKKVIKQGVMQQLLTGKKRLPGFGGEWKEKKLRDIADFLKGRGLSKSKLLYDGSYSCILYGELYTTYSRIIKEVKSKTNSREGLPSINGDILMPGSTTTVGIDLATASALQQNNVLLGGDLIVIRKKEPNNYNSEFLANYLTHISKYKIAEIAQGITIIHLHGSRLQEIFVEIPSDINEQTAIATILSDMDADIERLEKKRDKYTMLKQCMMQQLLTGRIRIYANN